MNRMARFQTLLRVRDFPGKGYHAVDDSVSVIFVLVPIKRFRLSNHSRYTTPDSQTR